MAIQFTNRTISKQIRKDPKFTSPNMAFLEKIELWE